MVFHSDPDEAVTGRTRARVRKVRAPFDPDQKIAVAKRHTIFVRVLRAVLPMASLFVVGMYGLSVIQGSDWTPSLANLSIPTILPDKLSMENPRYNGYDDDGSSYNVMAKTATQDFERPGVVLLEGISGELVDSKDSKTLLSATSGVFHSRKNRLELGEGIAIVSADGMRAKLKSATVLTKAGVISSNEPVSIAMRSSTLSANSMRLWHKKKVVVFAGAVKAHLKREPSTGANAAKRAPAAADGMFAGSQAPMDISSNSLKIVDAENRAAFLGNVSARQDNSSLKTKELLVYFEPPKDKSSGPGSVPPAEGKEPLGSAFGKIERVVANYPVLINRGQDQQVTSRGAEFFVADERAVLEGQVVIVSGQGQRVSSDRAEIAQVDETILLEGNVVVKQSRNSLKGRRLFVDRKRGRMKLTSPPGNGAGPGRVRAILHRDAQGKTKKTKASTKPSKPGLGAADFKTNPDAPISIDADSLNVDNAIHAAVFSGNVVAKQGSFQIKSTTLLVQYSGQIEVADPSGSGATSVASKPKSEPELKKVIARKNVSVTSQSGQTATGDWAEFDVVANKVEIGGAVTLREGSNIIRGTLLKIDMDSGRSVIEMEPGQAGNGWASTAKSTSKKSKKAGGPPAGFDARGARPSAVFFPFQLKKGKPKKRTTPTATPPAQSGGTDSNATGGANITGASSWSATSVPAN